ncbi:hypothetical protein L6R52_17805 [Myxococcota bacterium]|nr:hypothetical protein [Myxococcota bacterium]
MTPSKALARLVALRTDLSAAAEPEKLALLSQLEHATLPRPRDVLTLHEQLSFARAYPSSPELLALVERMLAGFAARRDLARHRRHLEDTGITGTTIRYRFFWPIARWLAERWPGALTFDWPSFESTEPLRAVLPLLEGPAHAASLARDRRSTRAIVDELRGPRETDATHVIQRLAALPVDPRTREHLHDTLDSAYVLTADETTPSRTHAHHATGPIHFQRTPPSRARPDLRAELTRPPKTVRVVDAAEGQALVDLARAAMVTRSRDLEVFGYGDARDVRLVDDGDGLAFACIPMIPERRLTFRAAHAMLTLKNGVPIGYVQVDALFESAEIAFNTFETFRGAEAAHVFARLLAAVRHVFGATGFSIEPYQLGDHNDEGLTSGAWWFYHKLGFGPVDAEVLALARAEQVKMKRDPRHRSSRTTLKRLAKRHLFLDHDPDTQPVEAALDPVLWAAAEARATHGPDATARAAERLGLDRWSSNDHDEQLWIERWSPIVLALPGVEAWSDAERAALADVVRAKGGASELEYVRRFDAHAKLRSAMITLVRARSGAPEGC